MGTTRVTEGAPTGATSAIDADGSAADGAAGDELLIPDGFDVHRITVDQGHLSAVESGKLPVYGNVTQEATASVGRAESSRSGSIEKHGDALVGQGQARTAKDNVALTLEQRSDIGRASGSLTLAHREASARGGLKQTEHSVEGQGQANAEGSLAAFHQTLATPGGAVAAKFGGELAHAQGSATAEVTASRETMSLDARAKVHVDLSAVTGEESLHLEVPVDVNGKTLHVKVDLNGAGALGANGDLEIKLHVGRDGTTVGASASGSLVNASIQGRVEIDGSDGKTELAEAQVKTGAQYGAGAGGEMIMSPWRSVGKAAVGPVKLSWAAEVKPLAVARELYRIVKG